MEKDISKMTDGELESLGYKLYETKEQLVNQMNQVNQSLLMIRAEKQNRIGKEKHQEVQEKPVVKTSKTSKE